MYGLVEQNAPLIHKEVLIGKGLKMVILVRKVSAQF
jgi:hypothetical protein